MSQTPFPKRKGKLPIFNTLSKFQPKPICSRKICRNGPFLRDFVAQKPTHMGDTYSYLHHVMYLPQETTTSETEQLVSQLSDILVCNLDRLNWGIEATTSARGHVYELVGSCLFSRLFNTVIPYSILSEISVVDKNVRDTN